MLTGRYNVRAELQGRGMETQQHVVLRTALSTPATIVSEFGDCRIRRLSPKTATNSATNCRRFCSDYSRQCGQGLPAQGSSVLAGFICRRFASIHRPISRSFTLGLKAFKVKINFPQQFLKKNLLFLYCNPVNRIVNVEHMIINNHVSTQ